MSRRRCCCGCYTFTDAFNREASDEINSNPSSPDWEECGGGDWEIKSNHLHTCTADEAVVLLHMVGNPVGILNARITYFKAPVLGGDPGWDTYGSKYQILVFWGTQASPCTAADAYIVEFEATDGTTGTLRLYANDGVTLLSDRQVTLTGAGGAILIEVCVNLEYIWATCEHIVGMPIEHSLEDDDCNSDIDGYYFALRSGSGCVYYDSIEYIDQYDHNKLCPPCTPWCCCPHIEGDESDMIHLRATIVAPGCAMDGVTTVLSPTAGRDVSCRIWNSDSPLTFECPDDSGVDCTGKEYSFDLTLSCGIGGAGGDGCEHYRLTVEWTFGSINYSWCDLEHETQTKDADQGCTCCPVYLSFSGYIMHKLASIMEDCCDCCPDPWQIVIVEEP